MLLFSGNSNKSLAEKVANELSWQLGQVEIIKFPDNENRVRIIDEVVDQDVAILESTAITPNLYYMELFLLIDGLKRSGARSITLIIPYLGYQRQDHIFRSGEAVSLEVIIKIIEDLGVESTISFDFHSIKIPELFKNKITHLSALPLFAEKIKSLDLHNYTLVTPDMGGIRRIEIISEMLDNAPHAEVEKNRDLNTGSVESMILHGETNKTAVIVDDVISTGKTLVAAANLLKEKGAEEIFVFATHGVFADNAAEILQNSIIKKVVVTDTIEVPEERKFEKLEIISVAKEIVNALEN